MVHRAFLSRQVALGAMTRSVALLCVLSSLAACAPASPSPAPRTARRWSQDTDAAWSAMTRALPGRFKATTSEGKTITVAYRVVSNGSALVETFTTASGKETLSIYHRDGRELMLTHYCAQGNQVRLKAAVARSDAVVFSFLDATNVSADQGVMQELSIAVRSDGFDQRSVYRAPTGEPDATELRFERVQADPKDRPPGGE
jgi:hypothetical protein